MDWNSSASKLIHQAHGVRHFVAGFITDISAFLTPTLRLFAPLFSFPGLGSKRNDPGN